MSDSGEHALLVTNKLDLYLWELREGQHSEWWKLPVPGDIGLPPTSTRHAATDTSFYVHQVLLHVYDDYHITCTCRYISHATLHLQLHEQCMRQ